MSMSKQSLNSKGSYAIQQPTKDSRERLNCLTPLSTEIRLEQIETWDTNLGIKFQREETVVSQSLKDNNATTWEDGTVLVTAYGAGAAHMPPRAELCQSTVPYMTDIEVEEAALRCYWLSHYWALAQQLGIYTEIAGDKEPYWRALAPPQDAFYSIVDRQIQTVVGPNSEASVATTSFQGEGQRVGQAQTSEKGKSPRRRDNGQSPRSVPRSMPLCPTEMKASLHALTSKQ
ncbi:hypothetical protein CEUSTIGMA_g5171.t1 [Chlamydomonas eustigma]|uniref:Uncharacterized protein n=1 Tax=Chlamydomonas eustigma TaxID=1157962 RepID=A0A250X3S4_9CHLO|nr:hypothetical protein CEUSTIGMA_g5171.t1 [Chlamydomonas eustigma]|eukprot:GAX77728.1 hypothetical protein CEUSTIGMA_g5171.t1 [Chlamydomonas eustigma]